MGKYMMLLLLLLLGMIGTCYSSSNWGGCPPEERSALLRLKQELNDQDDLLTSWKGLYCCSWTGIACHRGSGHVARLDLGDYSLSAVVRNSSSQIFPSLFQLQHLEYLDLSYVDLSPLPFPSRLPNFTRLTHLSLFYCGLTGRIPGDIGNLSSLTFLDISYNTDLMGQIPSELGNISSLKVLYISGNSHLELRQRSLWLRNLRGLEEIYMFRLNVSSGDDGVVANVASLTKLTTLSIPGVFGTALSSLVNLTSLSHLFLIDSDVTHPPFPIWISNLTSLVTLELYNYSLHDSIPSTVSGLPLLRNLYLYYNRNLNVNLSSIVQHASQLSIPIYWPFKCGRSDSKLYWEYVFIE